MLAVSGSVPEEQMPLEAVDLQEDLTYKEQPIQILEISERVTRLL